MTDNTPTPRDNVLRLRTGDALLIPVAEHTMRGSLERLENALGTKVYLVENLTEPWIIRKVGGDRG
ncbi:MAG TPA: hypothetical protein VG497_10300 [Kribbella sp.]|nr:hypothetical protein [Kribbella sp.]